MKRDEQLLRLTAFQEHIKIKIVQSEILIIICALYMVLCVSVCYIYMILPKLGNSCIAKSDMGIISLGVCIRTLPSGQQP